MLQLRILNRVMCNINSIIKSNKINTKEICQTLIITDNSSGIFEYYYNKYLQNLTMVFLKVLKLLQKEGKSDMSQKGVMMTYPHG